MRLSFRFFTFFILLNDEKYALRTSHVREQSSETHISRVSDSLPSRQLKKQLWDYFHRFLVFITFSSNSKNTFSKQSVLLDKSYLNEQAESILTTYGNHILRFAYSYLHNISDAEEILQDTLLQFLIYQPNFENDEHKKAWLLRVAGNLSKNRIRYNSIRQTDELQESLIATNSEDLSFVWEAVRSLPIKYRESIHLFYYEGYSTSQIASVLGAKESTIRSNLHRGRLKLKEILKEDFDFKEGI